jgi:acetyl-CoA carboxylase/biotin carboxylase 1
VYVIHLLEREEYKQNRIHTGWLDGLIALKVPTIKPDNMLVVLCGALYRAHDITEKRTHEYILQLGRGQVPHNEMLSTKIPVELIYLNTKYRLTATRSGPHHYTVTLGGDKTVVEAQVRTMRDDGLLILLDGNLRMVYGREDASGLRLIVDSKTCMFSHEYDPTHLRTTTPGKLVRHIVPDGSSVCRGQAYAEVEVMKMYLNLTAPEDGKILWVLSEGSSMAAGDLLARMELDDPSRIMLPVEFEGRLPATKPPSIVGDKPHQLLRTAIASVKRIIEGYDNQKIAETVDEMLVYLANPQLPLFELRETLSVLTGRLPRQLMDSIDELLANYEKELGASTPIPFEGKAIQKLIEEHTAGNAALSRVAAPLHELAGTYADGLQGHTIYIISSIITDFLTLERLFYNKHTNTVLRDMREKHKDQLAPVMNIALALHPQSKRSTVVSTILLRVEALGLVDCLADLLTEVSLLSGRNMDISMRAKRMLIRAQLPSVRQRMESLEEMLRAVVKAPEDTRMRDLKAVVHIPSDLLDVLLPLIAQSEPCVREVGLEVYIRRSYNAYQVTNFKILSTNPLHAEWTFAPYVQTALANSSEGIVQSKTPRKGVFVLVEPKNTPDAIESTILEALSMYFLLSFVVFSFILFLHTANSLKVLMTPLSSKLLLSCIPKLSLQNKTSPSNSPMLCAMQPAMSAVLPCSAVDLVVHPSTTLSASVSTSVKTPFSAILNPPHLTTSKSANSRTTTSIFSPQTHRTSISTMLWSAIAKWTRISASSRVQ